MFKIELAGFDFDSRARGNRQGLTLAPVSGGMISMAKKCEPGPLTHEPRLNQLLKGKIQLFSLDSLVNMLAEAGMRVNMTVKKAA